MKTVDFSETIAASDLKVGRCRQLIEIMKVPYVSIEGQGHFLTIYFPGFVCTRPRYQVSVYRTIGPLVLQIFSIVTFELLLLSVLVNTALLYLSLPFIKHLNFLSVFPEMLILS